MKTIYFILVLLFTTCLYSTIINVPADQPTIQQGIDVSADSDTILVQPGTYVENINYNGKNITVASLFLTTQDTSYISQTIIDGNQIGSVVTFESGEDSTAVLSGFSIINGDGAPYGGGIECNASSPSLEYLTVTDNSGGMGGGIGCRNNCNSYIKNVILTENNSYYGGGISCWENCSPILENVTITNNSDSDHGGGICCLSSSPSLENVTITGNSANMYYSKGGGIYCDYNSSIILANVIITGNSVFNNGGGIYCEENSNLILENVSITGNSAFYDGGGIYCGENSNQSMENVTIKGNSASNYGGGICCYNSNLSFSAENRCNIFLNFAARNGNDLYSIETLNVIVDTFTIQNPTNYFASPINNFIFDILNSKIEQVGHNLYVNPGGSNNNSGLTPDDPLLTISYALVKIIADSTNLQTIHLSNGVYSPSQTGEIFPLNCKNYVSLKGESEEYTVLDGNDQSSIIFCYLDNYLSIEDMTIQNGLAYSGGGIHCSHSNPSLINLTIQNNSANCEDSGGGGIFCSFSSPSMLNLTITGNSADGPYAYGGGILFDCSSSILENVIITGNSADYGGGICCFDKSNLSLLNVVIKNNYAYCGGGICCWDDCAPSLVNVIITNNSAGYGGAIYCHRSSPSLENVTMTGNFANHDGGGLNCQYSSNPSLTNCILWNDSPQEVFLYGYGSPNSIEISYSDIQGGEAGIVTNNNGTVNWLEGNLNDDPLFVGIGEDPYSLLEDSPCIDAGIPDTTGLNLPPWDIIGNHRIWDGDGNGSAIIDMGAYEYGAPPYVNVDDNVIVQTPEVFLQQNYPNPFNPLTTIEYSITQDAHVSLNIYNIKGQKVKTLVHEVLPAGEHSIIWNGTDNNGKSASSGIYFYKLNVNGKDKAVKKMLLLK